MNLELWQLQAAMPLASARASRFLEALNSAFVEFEIDTKRRIAMFLAQIAEESGELRYVRELWGPTPQQARYERNFTEDWSRDNQRNRLAFDLGNSEAGDGFKFSGRGLIQITGRSNYTRMSEALYGNARTLLDTPQMLEQASLAVRSAAVYWTWRGLNAVADADDLVTCTRRVNGGLTHQDRRERYYALAQQALA